MLKYYKHDASGEWVKRTTKADKKKALAKKKKVAAKKGLTKRFQRCKTRTEERLKSEPSAGEQRIISFLTQNKIKFIREYYNPKLFNPETDNMLYFDFYIPAHNLYIEYDGIHHFKPIHGEEKLRQQKLKDRVKDKWCKKHGWPLLRISCFETDKIEDLICLAFDKIAPIK